MGGRLGPFEYQKLHRNQYLNWCIRVPQVNTRNVPTSQQELRTETLARGDGAAPIQPLANQSLHQITTMRMRRACLRRSASQGTPRFVHVPPVRPVRRCFAIDGLLLSVIDSKVTPLQAAYKEIFVTSISCLLFSPSLSHFTAIHLSEHF